MSSHEFAIPKHLPLCFKLALTEVQKRAALEMAYIDKDTGVANLNALHIAFKNENRRIARGESKGAVLLLVDLDGLKSLNEGLEYNAGTQGVTVVGQTLNGLVRRAGDIAARIGGDEFVLLLTNTTRKILKYRMVEIESDLCQMHLTWDNLVIPLQVTTGAAQLDGKADLEKIIAVADAEKRANKVGKPPREQVYAPFIPQKKTA